jgi:hypothetical protein
VTIVEGVRVRIDCGLLCDAVTVRDGLMHILGGGVGRVRRIQYPSVLENDLALRLAMGPNEIDGVHKLEIRVIDSAGTMTSSLSGEFTMGGSHDQPADAEAFLNIPVSMRQVVIPAAGLFGIEIVVDGEHRSRLPLHAALVTPEG